MNRKLQVTNLSPRASPFEIHELFSAAGRISAITIVGDAVSRPDSGVAYVEMQSHDGAQAAIARFDQHPFQGRVLNVSAVVESVSPASTAMVDEGGPLRSGD